MQTANGYYTLIIEELLHYLYNFIYENGLFFCDFKYPHVCFWTLSVLSWHGP